MRQTPDSPTDFNSAPKLAPALAKRIEHWPLERLIPYARNARTHSDETGRHARLIELEPRYVDATIARWEQYVNRRATLDGTGQGFEQVRRERLAKEAEPPDAGPAAKEAGENE